MTSFPKTTRKAAPGLGGPMEIPTRREVRRATEGGIDNLTRFVSPVRLPHSPFRLHYLQVSTTAL
jgi:hypothetical protein